MSDGSTETSPHRGRLAALITAAVLVLIALAAYATLAFNVVTNAPLSNDEAQYLIRALWYENGTYRPYTTGDTSWLMPLYYRFAGAWIDLTGPDIAPLRWLSVTCGAVCAALMFTLTRKLTANTLAASAAAAIFLVTPSAGYAFATATPAAMVALLHTLALWLLIGAVGRPSLWRPAVFGVLLAVLFMTSRDTALIALALIPLYTIAVGRDRFMQCMTLIIATGAAIAGILWLYPARLTELALWGPLIAPVLDLAGIAPRALVQIDVATTGANMLSPAWPRDGLMQLVDTMLLPLAGALIACLALVALTGRALRVLWVVPIYLIWLVAGETISLLAPCDDCLVGQSAGSALPVAALGAGLSLAMIWRWARGRQLPGAPFVVGGALAVIAVSTFAPGLAMRSEYQFYPAAALRASGSVDMATDASRLGQLLIKDTSAGEQIVALHDVPALPYAIVMARRGISPQLLDPARTYRELTPAVTGARRDTVLAALEGHTLWTSDTLKRWLARGADSLLIETGNSFAEKDDAALLIAANFEAKATTTFAGHEFTLYTRRQ
ncbi:MAG: glycosyltransferase family 39 protein [Rhodobacteraceae bacterium]|nr:glycosyltransferase family 39 protein [Paracoccaceae bacterium]